MAFEIPRNHIPTPDEAFENMFGSSGQIVPHDIQDIPIEKLIDYPNQKWKMYNDEALTELAEDIKCNGILSPAIVRPHPTIANSFELLAGRNRKKASLKIGNTTLPCIIKDNINDIQAKLIVNGTNLNQRKKLYPSEIAWGYKMQIDAFNELEKSGISKVAELNNINRKEIYRYIQLTKLTEKLLDMVDNERIPVNAGIELSYITTANQEMLVDYLMSNEKQNVSIKQAKELRLLEDEKDFYPDYLDNLIFNSTEKTIEHLKFSANKLQMIIPPNIRKSDYEDYICTAIQFYNNYKK